LGGFGANAKTAVPALIDTLKASDFGLRYNSANALRMIDVDAKTAVPALMTAMKDPNEAIREIAKAALEQIDPKKANE